MCFDFESGDHTMKNLFCSLFVVQIQKIQNGQSPYIFSLGESDVDLFFDVLRPSSPSCNTLCEVHRKFTVKVLRNREIQKTKSFKY